MTDSASILEQLTRLDFEVWEHRDLIDGPTTSGVTCDIGTATWRPDGGISWDLAPPDDDGFDQAPYDRRHWSLFADDIGLDADGVAITSLHLHSDEPQVDARHVADLAEFLSGMDAHDAAFRDAIAAQSTNIAAHLIADMFETLPKAYLEALFPRCAAASDVAGHDLAAGLTLAGVVFHPQPTGDASGPASARRIGADYRFLVAEPLPDDRLGDDYLIYGGRYDVTNNVFAVSATLDGEVLDVSIES